MWANKSFSHCSITLPLFFSVDIAFLPLCLAILLKAHKMATVTLHYCSLDHRLVKWNCLGFPKESYTSKICPCQMKKKPLSVGSPRSMIKRNWEWRGVVVWGGLVHPSSSSPSILLKPHTRSDLLWGMQKYYGIFFFFFFFSFFLFLIK